MITVMMAGLALAASPGVTRRAAHNAAVCQQAKDSLAAGRTAADVAREIGVSEARVRSCLTQGPRPEKKPKPPGR